MTEYVPYKGSNVNVFYAIPDKYQEVEYVESPGMCWFDTSFTFDANDDISTDIVFQFLIDKNDIYCAGYGNHFIGVTQYQYGRYSSWYGSGNGAVYEELSTEENPVYMRKIHAHWTLTPNYGNSTTYPWRVFGRTYFTPSEKNTPTCRIWSHSMSINGNKVFDLVPAKRKSDGEVGMYDLITGTFYTNQGTGEGFIAGPNVTNSDRISTLYGGTVTINPDGSADVVATFYKWIENGSRKAGVWTRGGETDLYNRCLFGALPAGIRNYFNNNGRHKYYASNRKVLSHAGASGWQNTLAVSPYAAPGLYSFSYSIPKSLNTADDVAAYFAENPTEVVYQLSQPITYHFDNVGQLKVWLGENNFWCDISDDITVKYWNRG